MNKEWSVAQGIGNHRKRENANTLTSIIMKTKVRLSVIIVLLCSALSTPSLMATNETSQNPGSIHIAATADLVNVTRIWADAYQKQHPGQVVSVTQFERGAHPEVSAPCFITDADHSLLTGEDLWKMVVGREVIIPVTSVKNPALSNLMQHGLSQKELSGLMTQTVQGEKGVLGGEFTHCYILGDGSLKNQLAKYLKIDAATLQASMVTSSKELAEALAKDPKGLAFCRLSDVLQESQDQLLQGLSILPIDKNGNGILEGYENIYANLEDFMHGVWVGKYPGALTTNIYAIAPAKPTNPDEIAFLKWVVDEGQQYLNPQGLFELGYNEREARQAMLDNSVTLAALPKKSGSFQSIMLILLGLVVAGSVVYWLAVPHHNKRAVLGQSKQANASLSATGIEVPKGVWFDKSHTWAFMEQNGMVRVGIDDFLQHITGPLTRVQMKNMGEKVMKGEKIFTIIQDGKHLDICSPVSGTIRSYNGLLSSRGSLLNTAPFTEGWVYTIEPTNWLRDTEFLFMAEKYTNWIKQEFARLREFFANTSVAQQMHQMPLVLQDGGEVEDHVLASFGPELWEEFQMKFIDTTK